MYFQKLQEPCLVEQQSRQITYTDTEELKGHIQARKVMLNISLLASVLMMMIKVRGAKTFTKVHVRKAKRRIQLLKARETPIFKNSSFSLTHEPGNVK